MIRHVAADLEGLAESNNSKLKVRIASDLPSVRVDLHKITHVFTNFVSNAVKHSPQGEDIEITAAKRDDYVRFSVIDHGKGIPPQYQSRIFEGFFRLPEQSSPGAGLGLAIAKEIVTAHGGTIGVTSHLNQGSEFYFDLPTHT